MSETSTDRKTTAAAAAQPARGKDREQPEAATNGDLASLAEGARTALREADALGLARVVAVPPGLSGIGAAVADRLARAASGG